MGNLHDIPPATDIPGSGPYPVRVRSRGGVIVYAKILAQKSIFESADQIYMTAKGRIAAAEAEEARRARR